MRILISAGEASGDAYGAALVKEISRLTTALIEFQGIGSHQMRAANVELFADSAAWGAISILESLRVAPLAANGFRRVKQTFRTGPKGLFIPIDFGWVNIRLSKAAKKAGWSVLYFIPPGSWRRDRQGKDLPSLTDAIVTPFPWSADLLRRQGANAFFFGHPIKQLHASALAESPNRSGLAVLPGSRTAEFEQLIPVFAETLRGSPQHVTFPVGPRGAAYLTKHWGALTGRPGDQIVDTSQSGAMLRCLKSSNAALVCSGTATLEAAMAQTPMIIAYKVGALVEFESKLIGFKRPKWVGLPNILLDRDVVPEFIQEDATPEKLARGLEEITQNEEIRSAQIRAFEELSDILGPADAITQTAQLALELLEKAKFTGQS